MSKKNDLELCACPDSNGASSYFEFNRFDESACDSNRKRICYGMSVSIDGSGFWDVIDIHPETGDIGVDAGDGIWYVCPSRVSIVH